MEVKEELEKKGSGRDGKELVSKRKQRGRDVGG